MSDPQGFLAEHFPRIYLWLSDLQTSWNYAMVGMVATRDAVNPSDWLKIVVGVVASAWLSAYATGERTAVEVKQYAAAQAEFRQEVRLYMREQSAEVATLRDRVTRNEVSINGQQGMGGMASKVPK